MPLTDLDPCSDMADLLQPADAVAMDAGEASGLPTAHARRPGETEEIRLLGQPPLGDLLDDVERLVIGGATMSRSALCDAWRRANDVYAEYEKDEAGLAETVGCEPLDDDLEPLVGAVRASRHFQETFAHLPVSFGMVEIDKLVVYQPRVNRTWAQAVAGRLGPAPSAEAVFRCCQQVDAAAPPLTVEETDDDRFVFSSPVTHIAFHEAVLLRPEQVPHYASYGPIAGIVGLVVGFRGNFLNVIRADDRILLNNGYHRAFALRSLGVTHVPCVIQDVSRVDELRLRAAERVGDDPAFYFRAKRPPLFKDFFDQRIARVFRMRPRRRVVEVAYEIRKRYLVE